MKDYFELSFNNRKLCSTTFKWNILLYVSTPVPSKGLLFVVYLLCCIKLFLCKIVIKIFIGTEALKCTASPNFSFGANFSDNPCILKLKTDTRHREQNSCLSDSVPLNYLQRVWFISGRYTRHPSWTAETQLFVNLYSYLSSVVTRSRFSRRTQKIYKSAQSTGGRWWRQWDLEIV